MGIFQQFPYTNFHEMNMDQIIKIVREMLDEWATYHATWEDWKNGVDATIESFYNWFNTLDVQDEINHKLNAMKQSGELTDLIEPLMPDLITAWLDANITEPTGVVIDASLTVSGACADAKAAGDAIKDVRVDVGRAFEIAFDDDTAINGYKYIGFKTPTGDKVLQIDGSIVNGTGSGNNFVWGEFIPIPKGKIYFGCSNDYNFNLVFYDAEKNVVDTWGSPSSMVSLYGQIYENSNASYMRVGAYNQGGNTDNNSCFAYSYNNENVKNSSLFKTALFTNTVIYPPDVETETRSKTRMLSDYIKAEEPTLLYLKDTSIIKYGVHLFDKNKEYLKSIYANDVQTYVSVPSGFWFRIYFANISGNISATPTIVNNMVIETRKDNIGFLSFNYNVALPTTTNARVGNIDLLYADEHMYLECDDYDTYRFNTALYEDKDSTMPFAMEYNYQTEKRVYIPKGVWYRYCVGKASGTTTLDDLKHITINKMTVNNTPEAEAINNNIGFARMKNAPNVPSYYVDHINNKIQAINDLYDENVLQFAFITDYHYGTYNQAHTTKSLITKIIENTHINKMFNGGDTWTSGTSVISFGEAKQRLLNGFEEVLPDAPCNNFFVLGNHDTGYDYGANDSVFGPYLTTEELAEIVGNSTGYDVVYDPNGYEFAYFVDFDNFRVIVLNNDLQSVGAIEPSYPIYQFIGKALMTMGNKTAVVISHEYLKIDSTEPYYVANRIGDLIVAFNAKSTFSIVTNHIMDFANCDGEVACWIFGHTHKDYSTTLSDGTPVIGVTTDNAGGEQGGLDRTHGTVNENAFDVFTINADSSTIDATRIGAGSNRHFSY